MAQTTGTYKFIMMTFIKGFCQKHILGLGESYMEGWWDSKHLDQLVFKVIRGNVDDKVKTWSLFVFFLKARILNYQNKSRAVSTGGRHYDLGNNLYQHMLDKTMSLYARILERRKNFRGSPNS